MTHSTVYALIVLINFTLDNVICETSLHFLDKYLLDDSRCLDGSPGAYHFTKGKDDGATKWLVSIEGGAWCFTNEECYNRSFTDLGSSKSYTPYELTDIFGNYFIRNPSTDNYMHNWNMILLRYCDGSSFTGNTQIVYNNSILYYKGSLIMQAFINELKFLTSNKITHLVVGGMSAGGLASIIHIDKFKNAFPNILITGLCDSGFFPFHDNKKCEKGPYQSNMMNLYNLMNSSAGIHNDCKLAGLGYRCLNAFDTFKFIQTPMFILQSKYDTYNIESILCINRFKYFHSIMKHGKEFEKALYMSVTSSPISHLHGIYYI